MLSLVRHTLHPCFALYSDSPQHIEFNQATRDTPARNGLEHMHLITVVCKLYMAAFDMLQVSGCHLSAGLQGTDMPPVLGVGAGVIHGDGPGVLEVKCPFNRGNPSTASPPKLPQWYYMPQVMLALMLGHIGSAFACV